MPSLFLLYFEQGSYQVAQAAVHDPAASASQVAEITHLHHHTQHFLGFLTKEKDPFF
jgi:hypothetical protein